MMNKLPFTGFAFMAVMFLASCGGGDVESAISDSTSEIEEAYEEVSNEIEEAYEEMSNEIEDAYEEMSNEIEDAYEEMSNEVVVSSNNAECDEFLEGYENFMDNYIVILKKSKADPTDMSIMTEYMSLMTEASEWTSKTPDCTDMEFLLKLSKIQMKMATAAAGM
jgi:replicative DNA helicase